MNASPLQSVPRIVIPVVAGIGNALLAVPMVRQIKRKLPESRITILARIDAMAEVFRRLPEVDEVIVTGKGIKGILRNISEARSRKPDVYLVPFPSNRWQYALLAAVSGAKRKVLHSYPVGYWRAMHFLSSIRVPAVRGIHDVEQNLRLLTALGVEPDPAESPVFAINDDDRARAEDLLLKAGLSAEVRPIIIHAGSAQTVLAQAKRWPAESYAQLIGQLIERYGDRVVIVEGPDEAGVADEIMRCPPIVGTDGDNIDVEGGGSKGVGGGSGGSGERMLQPRVIRLNGPLGEAAALLARAEFYVGSDSGLAHLASAVGTQAITLFAPADPDRVCPFGQHDRVVQAPTACSPCFQYPWNTPYPKILCREPFCIRQITVESVLAKLNPSDQNEGSRPLYLQGSSPIKGDANLYLHSTVFAKEKSHGWKLGWMHALAWGACAIVLWFVGVALFRQFRQVDWSQVHFRLVPVLASVVCLLGVSVMQLIARWTLLIAYGYPLTWRVQLPVAWVPQLGKYLPGGIASVGGAVYLLRKNGVPAAIGLSVAVLLDALAVVAGLIVSTPLLVTDAIRSQHPTAWIACIVITFVGLLMLYPPVFVGLLNFALKKIRRQPIAEVPPIRRYLWPVLASFGQWVMAGFGLWFMAKSITEVSINSIPLFVASAALAMTASYLTPFTPGGVGIREGLYLLTLKPLLGGPGAAIVAVAMRIMQTLIELLLAAIGAALLRRSDKK